jgi:hypothetical protein
MGMMIACVTVVLNGPCYLLLSAADSQGKHYGLCN